MSQIPFAKPDMSASELEAVRSVLNSGWLTTGPMVQKFEERITEIAESAGAVAVDSCTTALEFVLRLLNIGPGDEVITTPLTYTATADVIYAVGAKAVFADLDGFSFEMDYEDVARKITTHTKAVIAVDYGGKVCNYNRIFNAVQSRQSEFRVNGTLQESLGRVAVIADAAHSFGANRGGHMSGSYADFTCFSFHVLKNITTGGEGGAVCWRSRFDGIEDALKGLRHHFQTGKSPANGWEYDILHMGFNRPMTDINAAIGLEQLNRFKELKKKREYLTRVYDDAFLFSDQIRPLLCHFSVTGESAYHLYPVKVNPLTGNPTEEFRNRVILKMREFGIPCNVHYKPLPMFTAYKRLGFDIQDYPKAYQQYKSLITIPYHTLLTTAQQEEIAGRLREAVRKA